MSLRQRAQRERLGFRTRRWIAGTLACVLIGLVGNESPARAATPEDRGSLTVFQSGAGRFEVAGKEIAATRTVTDAAEECWRILASPLGLPESFSAPIFVRLIPANDWHEPAPFRTLVEPGGIVSVRIGTNPTLTLALLRRVLVQGLLTRLAVSHHGVSERLTVPLWLELACVGWWETRSEPAQLDAMRQASRADVPPDLAGLLRLQRGEAEPTAYSRGALWLLTALHGEADLRTEWPDCLRRLLGGESGDQALAAAFPGRYGDVAERELWWQVSYVHVQRARVLPGLDIEESREAVAGLARFVLQRGENDAVVSLEEVLRRYHEPFIRAEVVRRGHELTRVVPALHPFYRNAALSLGEAFEAARSPRKIDASKRAKAIATFERDWADANELAAAARAALDRLETSQRR